VASGRDRQGCRDDDRQRLRPMGRWGHVTTL